MENANKFYNNKQRRERRKHMKSDKVTRCETNQYFPFNSFHFEKILFTKNFIRNQNFMCANMCEGRERMRKPHNLINIAIISWVCVVLTSILRRQPKRHNHNNLWPIKPREYKMSLRICCVDFIVVFIVRCWRFRVKSLKLFWFSTLLRWQFTEIFVLTADEAAVAVWWVTQRWFFA